MGADPPEPANFVVEPLSKGQMRAVYPLLRHAGVEIDLKTWLRYARKLADAPAGARRGAITVRRVESRHPCGLFCYARETDLVHGNVLRAEHFVALDIVYPEEALAALLDGLEALGETLGIRTVRAMVGPHAHDINASLREAGLSTDGMILTKILIPPDPRL